MGLRPATKEVIMMTLTYIFYFSALGLFALASIQTVVFYHEQAHQQIFKMYNIDSTIEYHFLSGKTISASYDIPEKCIFLQSLNEIVGYSLISMTYVFWAAIIMIVVWLVIKHEDDKVEDIYERLR